MIKIDLIKNEGFLLFRAAFAGQSSLRADIRADTNRDGTVDLTGHSDVIGKQKWTESHGALFLPNIGDTDRRCSKKALTPYLMAPVRTVPIPGLPSDAKGFVSVVEKTAQGKKELEKGLKLGVDGRDTRRPNGWDGHATLRFSILGKNLNSTDEVHMRVAPVLTHHHLQSVQQVIAVEGNTTETPWQKKYTEDLSNAVHSAGLNTDVYLFNRSDDIWAQDWMEPGYASMPGPNGTISIRIMIRTPQDERVAGRQLFEYYRKAGVGAVQHLGGARDEINSGGNIEAVPPHTNGRSWPAGRIILGNHGKQKHHLLPYFQAQETQDPILLDTDWLVIGHVDEFLQFLPADNERGWVVVVDDPRAGIEFLKITPMTIAQALNDKELLQINHQCAERIDANIEILKKEVGLTDKDFIHIPSLFKQSEWGASDEDSQSLKVASFFPGVINNLVLSGFNTCIAPNPWGPSPNGTDVLAAAIRKKYAEIGISLVFVDDWNTHHNYGGEVHCGSNTVRDMSQAWWRD
ncbi:hypothetical protein P170DRAFT_349062 [Aspergillus steynii IBT 23096]|uniref:Protein-arginine deiminase C-terminal domain-containing protein n=1 Tax=Aspergillus steynii IBT 23096 TaxID=1392250 RepID=A0A2I2GKE0_9EURO|nr:uncharacterized protein P170DRAFT_349062 [Aspergillus steynii IBT 23096]PLB53346.1 hypothetical protein P170DRAFT_349062 [Aspergillus steynii IBT 23096]